MWSSLKSIDITYQPINVKNTFTNGDCVKGHVILEVVKDCKIDSLRIKFKGKAEVTLGDGESGVHSKEKYFSIKLYFIQARKSNGQDEETLLTNENGMLYSNNVTPGRHVYPFTLRIPAKQMPSSFHRGPISSISYTLSTKLSRSLMVPLKASSKINFVSTVDPTRLPELMMPQHDSKFMKMNIFSTGTLSMDVNIEKMRYRQGLGVVVASIQNNLSQEIKPKYCIYRKLSFFAKGVSFKDVLKETGEPIPPSANQTVTKIISIPLDKKPAILNCGIIRAEYRLRVYLDVKFASNPEIKFPIVILAATQMPAVEKQYGALEHLGCNQH